MHSLLDCVSDKYVSDLQGGLIMMQVIGIDTETYDPLLTGKGKQGASWVYGTGEVLCTSLYYESSRTKTVLHGNGGDTVRNLLTDKNVVLIGANIVYDLGWLCYEFRMSADDIKATLIDVLIAESHIDEYAPITLEYVGQKYCHKGKADAHVGQWLRQLVIDGKSVYKGGDFRKYLKYARDLRWDLLEEYAADDASLPCEVWREQCRILEAQQDRYYYDGTYVLRRQDGWDDYGQPVWMPFRIPWCRSSPLTRVYRGETYEHVSGYDPCTKRKMYLVFHMNECTPYERQQLILKGTMYPLFIDFALIKITLRAKQNGMKLDWAQKKINADMLRNVHAGLQKSFEEKYGKVNTKSSPQKAAFFDRMKFPYKDRITVKSLGGEKPDWTTGRAWIRQLNRSVMKGFRFEKGKIVFYSEHAYSARIVSMIEDEGYTCICNPYIDKTVLAEMASDPKYKVCSDILALNKTEDILTKFLGEEYDRFKGADGRIHSDLNISRDAYKGTKTGRLSSSCPNCMQIAAHGELDLEGVDIPVDIAELCRSLFLPDKGYWAHLDYPQIEFRLFAHFACGYKNDPVTSAAAKALRQKLRDNPELDFHSIVAEITGLPRPIAKRITFGTLYGMGIAKLRKDFGYTEAEAEEVFAKYFDNVPCVKSTMKVVSGKFIERGYVTTIAGRHFHLHSENEAYKGINGLDQGSSADMTKRAIVMADDEGLWNILKFYLTVHDELDFDVPETKKAAKAVLDVSRIMSDAYIINVPVFVKPEIGENWFRASDKDAEKRFKDFAAVKGVKYD
jgi:hypothetical protein